MIQWHWPCLRSCLTSHTKKFCSSYFLCLPEALPYPYSPRLTHHLSSFMTSSGKAFQTSLTWLFPIGYTRSTFTSFVYGCYFIFICVILWCLFPPSLDWKLHERRKPCLFCLPSYPQLVVNKYVKWMNGTFFFFFAGRAEDSYKHIVFEKCCSRCCGFYPWIKSEHQTVVYLDNITLFPHIIASSQLNFGIMPLVQIGVCCKW